MLYRGLALAFLMALLVAWALRPAFAQDDGVGAFRRIQALIVAGQHAEALALAGTVSPDPVESARIVKFTQALIFKVQERYADAAALMRELLDDDPRMGRVRTELADTLYLMRDYDAAKYHLQLLSDAAANPASRDFYQQFLDAIDTQRPWSVSGYVGFAPSSNINNGINSNTVLIGGVPFTVTNQQKQSGIGAAYGFTGSYVYKFSGNFDIASGAKLDGRSYLDKQFDLFNVQAFSEVGYTAQQTRLGIGLASERTALGWRGYQWAAGPRVSARTSLGDYGVVLATVSVRKLHYDDIDAYNGYQVATDVRYRYAFDAGTAVVIGGMVKRDKLNVDFNSRWGYRPIFEFYKDLPLGIISNVQVSYEIDKFDQDYPLMGTPRRDQQLQVTAGATLRRLSYFGFAPRFEYTYTSNRSNVELYQFQSHTAAAYLTKKF